MRRQQTGLLYRSEETTAQRMREVGGSVQPWATGKFQDCPLRCRNGVGVRASIPLLPSSGESLSEFAKRTPKLSRESRAPLDSRSLKRTPSPASGWPASGERTSGSRRPRFTTPVGVFALLRELHLSARLLLHHLTGRGPQGRTHRELDRKKSDYRASAPCRPARN